MQNIPRPLVKCLLLSFTAIAACCTGASAADMAAMTNVPSLTETAQPLEDVCAWPGQAGSFSAGLAEEEELLAAPCTGGTRPAYPVHAIPDNMPTEVPQAPSYLLLLSGCGAILLKRRKQAQAEPWAHQPI